jgi:hypothetical protein
LPFRAREAPRLTRSIRVSRLGGAAATWPHDGAVAGGAARPTGSSTTIAKFLSTDMGALRRAFAPTFPVGELLPWRGVAAESGAAPSAALLLDLRGPPSSFS